MKFYPDSETNFDSETMAKNKNVKPTVKVPASRNFKKSSNRA